MTDDTPTIQKKDNNPLKFVIFICLVLLGLFIFAVYKDMQLQASLPALELNASQKGALQGYFFAREQIAVEVTRCPPSGYPLQIGNVTIHLIATECYQQGGQR